MAESFYREIKPMLEGFYPAESYKAHRNWIFAPEHSCNS